jgi:hypothetical protein
VQRLSLLRCPLLAAMLLQALYQIVTITGPALLPVGMNEASSAVKDMLFAAAAAAQYSRPAPPPSSCSSAGTYRERGLDAQAAYLAGANSTKTASSVTAFWCRGASFEA